MFDGVAVVSPHLLVMALPGLAWRACAFLALVDPTGWADPKQTCLFLFSSSAAVAWQGPKSSLKRHTERTVLLSLACSLDQHYLT